MEVSWDGGKRWHPAHDTFEPCPDRRIVCGTFSWGTGPLDHLYDAGATADVLSSPGTAFISRAADDSGNVEMTKLLAHRAVVAPSMGPNPAVPLKLTGKETTLLQHDEL